MTSQLKSIINLGVYLLLFLFFESTAHYIQIWVELGFTTTCTLRLLGILASLGSIIEVAELAFGVEIKPKIRLATDEIWERVYSRIKRERKSSAIAEAHQRLPLLSVRSSRRSTSHAGGQTPSQPPPAAGSRPLGKRHHKMLRTDEG